jgi:excisionase family DNA binding protein
MPLSMTIKQAMQETGLGLRSIYELIGQGDLKSVKIGRRRLVDAKSLAEVISRGVHRLAKGTRVSAAADATTPTAHVRKPSRRGTSPGSKRVPVKG